MGGNRQKDASNAVSENLLYTLKKMNSVMKASGISLHNVFKNTPSVSVERFHTTIAKYRLLSSTEISSITDEFHIGGQINLLALRKAIMCSSFHSKPIVKDFSLEEKVGTGGKLWPSGNAEVRYSF
jgi:hypothetical protein